MRRRCNNQNSKKYKWYGGKGIKVCEEWDHGYGGFENFYQWAIENGYNDELTIDRIDSDKDYEPSNCRWITLKENIHRAVTKKHKPEYQYFAYNEKENIILIFYKTKDFAIYTGYDSRRVSDGCKNSEYTYKGWEFKRITIEEANVSEGQETIPFGSRLGDELPAEVQIIRLSNADKDIVHSA